MANYCIFRSEKLKTHKDVQFILKEQHRSGDYDSKRADSTLSHLNSYSSDYDSAIKKYDALLPKKIRKNAVIGLNFMVTTSEEFKTVAEERAFYEKARQFISDRFGEVVGWAIHRDEKSTHMQLVTIPLVDGKLNARALIGGDKHKMHFFQNDFYEQVGKPFGLERGIENSQAQHKTVEEYHKEREKDIVRRESNFEKSRQEAEIFLKSLDENITPLPKLEKVSNIGTAEKLEQNFPVKKTGKFSHETSYEYANRHMRKIWDWVSEKFYNPLVEKCNKLLKAVQDLKQENVLQKNLINRLERENKALNGSVDKIVEERVESRLQARLDASTTEIKAERDKYKSLIFDYAEFTNKDTRKKVVAEKGLLHLATVGDNWRHTSPEILREYANKIDSLEAVDYADCVSKEKRQKSNYQGFEYGD